MICVSRSNLTTSVHYGDGFSCNIQLPTGASTPAPQQQVALGMSQVGIFEVKSSRFHNKQMSDSPALAIERQHLLEVGSVGDQQDRWPSGR